MEYCLPSVVIDLVFASSQIFNLYSMEYFLLVLFGVARQEANLAFLEFEILIFFNKSFI